MNSASICAKEMNKTKILLKNIDNIVTIYDSGGSEKLKKKINEDVQKLAEKNNLINEE